MHNDITNPRYDFAEPTIQALVDICAQVMQDDRQNTRTRDMYADFHRNLSRTLDAGERGWLTGRQVKAFAKGSRILKFPLPPEVAEAYEDFVSLQGVEAGQEMVQREGGYYAAPKPEPAYSRDDLRQLVDVVGDEVNQLLDNVKRRLAE